MRLEHLHRRHSSALSAPILLRHAGKLGLGLAIVAVVMTSRSAAPAVVHPAPHALATNVLPTSVPCGTIQVDPATNTAVWTATSSPYGTGSPYILPWNDPKISSTDTTRQPNCLTTDAHGNPVGDDLHLAPGTKLVIDGSQGPVQIFSHGTGISVDGGEIRTINTSATNFISFDAEPDVASWDGIAIHASDAAHLGDGSFSYVTIQHALTALSIDSGAVSTLNPDPTSPSPFVPYGLAVANSGIGPSYFDGIDAKNTPIAVTGLRDGQYGTVNNIGSQGINVSFDNPPKIGEDALKLTGLTFGSSVPFGETGCPPEPTPCANRVVGSIGNNAVVATVLPAIVKPVFIDQNKFFRAGSFGIDLENANHPMITNNDFVCNGSGSPSPVTTCTANGTLQKFSAIYLNNVTADLLSGPPVTKSPTPPTPPTWISNNVGQENGLDAVVISGLITSDVTWKTPTNDPNGPGVDPPHDLGYMVANVAGTGGLEITGSTLKVQDGDVVKAQGGGITLTGGFLDASSGGLKSFTSMRDNGVGIQACPSVFVQSCLATLPSNEWIGIDLSGATANINNANILFPTKGVYASGPSPTLTGSAYSLVVTGSRIGPTFSDSLATSGVSAYVANTHFCRIDEAPLTSQGKPNPNYLLGCLSGAPGAGPGDHGINADFSGMPHTSALTVLNNDFQGSTNEAIFGTHLGGQAIDIEGNTVESAGTFGMQLVSADNLTLKRNTITGSGTGTTASLTYPAIYLNGIANADFSGAISGNLGTGNGLNAIAMHGSTANGKPLNWLTVNASNALGYLVDGDLHVNGDLNLTNSSDYAPVLTGTITVLGGTLTTNGATFTSLKDRSRLPTCGSVFVPKLSQGCPSPAPGDWGGLVLDPSRNNAMTSSRVQFATTGITIGGEVANLASDDLALKNTTIENVAADGIVSESPISVDGGGVIDAVSKPSSGHGIVVNLSGQPAVAGQSLSITGTSGNPLRVTATGKEGVLVTSGAGQGIQVSGISVDHAGMSGINLADASNPTVNGNTVTNTAAGFPAIYLNRVDHADFNVAISGNRGALNGVDALAFHGNVDGDLVWLSARSTADPTNLLGYIADGDVNMNAPALTMPTLTVNAGGIVKISNGALNLAGARLDAGDTANSSQKVFTSLKDNTIGVPCPVGLRIDCSSAGQGDWGGVNLTTSARGLLANGTFVNSAIRYATTGIFINSQATATAASSVFGLVVQGSSIAGFKYDGISSLQTGISVTNTTISGGIHGINVDLTNAVGAPLRISGNRLMSTSAEAILGQALAGQPVWITENQVRAATTFGIRLLGANQLVLRNNNISGSGLAGGYPAIYLKSVSADFVSNVHGNIGSGNGLDALVIDGKVVSDLSWITPKNSGQTHALGYLLDGDLTLAGTNLNVKTNDVVKVLGGAIVISGGSVTVTGTASNPAIFTSMKDTTGTAGAATSCPSIFTACGSAAPADWKGLRLMSQGGQVGSSSIVNGLIEYADTGIAINSGPVGQALPKLSVTATTILHINHDAINAFDSPIDVENNTIGDATALQPDIGGNGVIASFFSPANCPPPAAGQPACARFTVIGNHIYETGVDGIVANGLTSQPTIVSNNDIHNAQNYGIRLIGADILTMQTNYLLGGGYGSPGKPLRYPAIYLAGVKAAFSLATGGSTVAGNHGLGNGIDAIVLHGEATQRLNWITRNIAVSDQFGYVLDGGLVVDGALTTTAVDIVEAMGGMIKVNGALTSAGTTFTSLKDANVPVQVCSSGANGFDSVLAQRDNNQNCPPPSPGDWGGINIDPASSTVTKSFINYADTALQVNGGSLSLTDSTIEFAKSDGVDLNGATGTLERDFLGNIGGANNFAIKTASGGVVTGTCLSLHGNVSGTSSNGASIGDKSSISESDFSSTFTKAVVSTGGEPAATADWWGQSVGPNVASLGGAGNLDFSGFVASQQPTVTNITATSDNTKGNPANHIFGAGTVGLKVTSSRRLDKVGDPHVALVPGTGPAISLTPIPGTIVWSTDGHSWSAKFAINNTVAPVGGYQLTVSNANGAQSCVVDPSGGTRALQTGQLAITLDYSPPAISYPAATDVPPASIPGQTTVTLNAKVNPLGFTSLATGGAKAYFQLADSIAGLTAATPLGTVTIGSGSADVPISLTTLLPNNPVAGKTYYFRAVAVSENAAEHDGAQQTFVATGAAASIKVTAVNGSTTPPFSVTAGQPFTLTLQAVDGSNGSGTKVGSFTDVVHFASSDQKASLPGDYPFTLADGGQHTFSNIVIRSTTTGSLTISDASDPTPGNPVPLLSVNLTVNADKLDHLLVSGTKSQQTIGTDVTYTATGFDSNGNSLGDVTGQTTFTITQNGNQDGSCTPPNAQPAKCRATTADPVSGTHVVRGVATVGGASGSGQTTLQAVGTEAQLVVSGSVPKTTINSAVTYRAQAYDSKGNLLGDVSDSSNTSWTITAPGGTAVACPKDTTNHVATCTPAAADAVNGTHVVTATDSSVTPSATGSASLKVVGPESQLVVSGNASTATTNSGVIYTAKAYDSNGNLLGDVTASNTTTWTMSPDGSCSLSTNPSTNTKTLTCTPTGADAVNGTHVVTATDSSVTPSATGSASLKVVGPATQLRLTPPSATISASTSQDFSVEAFDAKGNDLGNVTTSSAFSIKDGNNASDGSCTNNSCGKGTADDVGKYHIVTAQYGGQSAAANLHLTGGLKSYLLIAPDNDVLTVGSTKNYTAKLYDSNGVFQSDVTSSTAFAMAPNGACVAATCGTLTTADTAGSFHTITASYPSVGTATASGVTSVKVRDVASQLVISGSKSTATTGSNVAFTAEAFDNNGNDLGDVTGTTGFAIKQSGTADGTCNNGTCPAVTADSVNGSHVVTGTNGASSGQTSLKVVGPESQLVVSGNASTATTNSGVIYTATAYDGNGNFLGDVTASSTTTWTMSPNGSCSFSTNTSTNTKTLTCTPTGADAVNGTHVVTATDSSVTPLATGSASLRVLGPLNQMTLTPGNTATTAGTNVNYLAEGFDVNGNDLRDQTGATGTQFAITPNGSCNAPAACGSTHADTGGSSHTVTVSNGMVSASTTLVINPGSLDHLILSPPTKVVAFGGGQAYLAEGFDAYNNDLGDVTSRTAFSVSNGSCRGATCSLNPTVNTAQTVTGTSGGKTGQAQLSQGGPLGPLARIAVSPATSTITARDKVSYTAEGYDANNNDLGDITSSTTFTISPDGSCDASTCTATVADNGTTHTVTAVNGAISGTASLTVNPGSLDHLDLNPRIASILSGSYQTYQAEGRDQDGNDLGDKTANTTFSIVDTNGSSDGTCTPSTSNCGGAATADTGTSVHTVTGTYNGKTGQASLMIRP